ncbi:E3 ubiquitin-protein ligase TRIM33-like [Branchiostoma floridae x Branchiostoma belcheri]
MAEAVLSQISGDFLECTICLEPYNKDPKILPCLHTFCKDCLEKFVVQQSKSKDKFPCPTCRIETVLPEGGVAGLKKNFFVLSLRDTVDAHKSLVSKEDDKVSCDLCEAEVATCGCVVCEEFLCKECARVHSRFKLTRDHKVIGVAELKEQLITKTSSVKSRSLPMCPKHEDEKLKFYCETCQHPICRDCTVLQHKDHKYGLLADVVGDVRAKIKGNLATAGAKIEEYRGAANIIATKQAELDTRSKKAADDIDAAAEEEIKYYTGLVRRKQTELKEKLAAVTAARSKQLSATADSVESTLGCLSSTVDFSQKVVEHGSDFDVMNVYSDVTARLESLLKGPTPDIPDDISYVRFDPRTERRETEIILGDILDHQPCFKLTTLGASGRLGPTTLGTHYRGQDHEHLVTLHDGIQHFTVPRTGTYSIETAGAAAGWGVDNLKSARGRGAVMRGTFNLKQGAIFQATEALGNLFSFELKINKNKIHLTKIHQLMHCETLKILVGQEGAENRSSWSVGGGGGTFVTRGDNTPLIIAGGGGGGGGGWGLQTHNPLCDGTVSTTGNKSYGGTGCSGGSNGQGATEWKGDFMGGGGGGLLTDGGSSKQFGGDSCEKGGEGGKAFVNGGVGGRGVHNNAGGGFGGGGGSEGAGGGGGGGGGYSGGGRGANYYPNGGGGGGGSFNSGTDTSGQDGANGGPGYVVITRQV